MEGVGVEEEGRHDVAGGRGLGCRLRDLAYAIPGVKQVEHSMLGFGLYGVYQTLLSLISAGCYVMFFF